MKLATKFNWAKILFSFFILSIPLSEIGMLNFGTFSISITEIIYLVFLFTYLIKLSTAKNPRIKRIVVNYTSLLLILFVLLGFISLFVSLMKGYGNYRSTAYFLRMLLWISSFFIIKDLLSKSSESINYFLSLVYYSGIILILLALLEIFGLFNPYPRPYWKAFNIHIVGGTFENPTTFGAFASIYLGIFIIKYLKDSKLRFINIILITLTSILMILTGSRAVLLQIILVILLSVYFLKRKKIKKRTLIVITIFILFTPLVVNKVHKIFTYNIKSSFDFQETDIKARFAIYKFNADLIQRNFLFGIGPGNYKLLFNELLTPKFAFLRGLNSTHNFFLMLFSELGIFSFFLFIVLVIRVFTRSFRKLRVHIERDYLVLGIWIGILVFYFGALFETLTIIGTFFMQFLLLGFLDYYGYKNNEIKK